MEVKFQDKSMKPWVSPRPDPVAGTQGGLKVERGRLSLAPLGSEGRDETPNGSNASDASVVVKRYRRFVAYRVTSFDDVVRLVAELLYRVTRDNRGSVAYLNGRRMRMLLGLDAPIHPIDLSVVYEVLSRLGFEVVEQSRGKAAIINMGHPLIKEIRNAENVDDVIKILKTRLGE